MLIKQNMHLEDYNCVFCASTNDETIEHLFVSKKKTIEHLFLQFPFAQDCWGSINLFVVPSWSPFAAFEHLKQQLATPFFMEVIILLSWSI